MFFDFGLKDIIDIVLVALMLFYIYRLMKESRSLNVFMGILMFIVLWLVVSQVLEMRLLGSIMDKLVSVGVIGLIVLFQEDIRKFLYNLGAHQRMRFIRRLFSSGDKRQDVATLKQVIMPIVMSCMSMSPDRHPALHPSRRYHCHRRTHRCLCESTPDRESVFQELSPARWCHDHCQPSHPCCRLYFACQSQPRHPQGTGSSSSCCLGYHSRE